MPTAKDYGKIAEEQEAQLCRLKAEFDGQSAQLDELFRQAEAMGLDPGTRPDLAVMTEAERRCCADFERQLGEIASLLTPVQTPRTRLPKMSRRSMV